MRQLPKRWRAVTIAVMLFAQFVSPVAPAICMAQTGSGPATGARSAKTPAVPTVARGQEYYEQARFDEAISLLRDLVDRGLLSGDDLRRARELLARAYVKKGYPEQGKEVFKDLLRDAPEWRPDPIRVPPDETAVFDEALKELQAETAAAAPPAPAVVTPPPAAATATAPEIAAKPVKPAKTPKGNREPRPAKASAPTAALAGGKKKSGKTLWYVIGAGAAIGIAAAAGGGSPEPAAPAQRTTLPALPPPPP